MRRLSKHLGSLTLTLIVGAILTIFSFVTLAHSNEINVSSSTQKGCNSSCASHGQPVAISSLKDEQDKDDKEPVPPVPYWQQLPISLLSLYLVPFAYIFVIRKDLKILLTTQMRL